MSQYSLEKKKCLDLYLNWFSGVVLVGMIVFYNWLDLLSVAAFVCAGTAIFQMTFCGYFAFIGEKELQSGDGNMVVWLPFCPLALVMLHAIGGRQYFDIMRPLGYSLITGLIVGLMIILCKKELRQSFDSALVMVIASVLFCAGIVLEGNHLLAGEPFIFHRVSIMEMYESGEGNSTDYNCVVRFPDGRELTVDVGREDYSQFEVGDTLTIPMRTGAFGIEYGYYGYVD